MYGVPTKRLNEQVKRNLDRFPIDFMFQLNEEEWENLKSHFATSSWGGRRTYPYAFTEQGVSMLSSVLKPLSGSRRRKIFDRFPNPENIFVTNLFDVFSGIASFQKFSN
jgi:hypothetical protein